LADQQTVAETAPIEAKPEPAVPSRGGPASVASVEKAIEHVNQIIESLRETLDDMEAVLETLELAERQKNADEYEIDSLRRSLNRLQRHRDSGA
jgi:hypothetical protein